MGASDWFSATAMFILFRETLEAAVILSVLLQFLKKTNSEHCKKHVWWGAGLGLAVAILVGVVFLIIYYTLDKEVFSGKGEQIFEGVVLTIATVMITVLGFAMLKMMAMQAKFERKLAAMAEKNLAGKQGKAMFIIAFTSVVREGIEAVLFLTGVGVDNPKAIPIAGVVGIILGIIVGYILFFSLKFTNLKWFFYISTAILLIIAAGLFRQAIHEFQESEEEEAGEEEDDNYKWFNKPLWNACSCCDDDDKGFWELLKAIVGWTCDPTFMELIAYISYWIVVACIFAWKLHKGTLTQYSDVAGLPVTRADVPDEDACGDAAGYKTNDKDEASTRIDMPVTAMFILFRETLEGAVILSVLLQFLKKTNTERCKKHVWWGAGLGLAVAILFGIIFLIIYHTLDKQVFNGRGQQIFEGTICVIATVMITVLAFGMLKMMAIQAKYERKLAALAETNIAGKQGKAMFVIAFTSVVREGIEAVLFMTGVGVDNAKAVPIAGVVGIILGIIVGYVLFFGLKYTNLKWFFYISTAVLLIIAAGLFRNAIHEYQEAGAFGKPYVDDTAETGGTRRLLQSDEAGEVEEHYKWYNKPLWNTCGCCSDDDKGFFELLKAIAGWTCKPTFMELIAYVGYWIVVAGIFAWKWHKGTLTEYSDVAGLPVTRADVPADGGDADLDAVKVNDKEEAAARHDMPTIAVLAAESRPIEARTSTIPTAPVA
eukprot:jgi/Chlat1/5714/Chrsp38S05550